MKTRIVYKLCAVIDDKYVSFDKREALFCLRYRIGKATKPKIPGSRLYVFDTLSDAKEFARKWFKDYVILECVGTNPQPIKNYVINDNDIINFWKAKRNRKPTSKFARLNIPPGTLLVNTVTPIQVIDA